MNWNYSSNDRMFVEGTAIGFLSVLGTPTVFAFNQIQSFENGDNYFNEEFQSIGNNTLMKIEKYNRHFQHLFGLAYAEHPGKPHSKEMMFAVVELFRKYFHTNDCQLAILKETFIAGYLPANRFFAQTEYLALKAPTVVKLIACR